MSDIRDISLTAIRRVWDRFCDTGDSDYLRGLPQAVADSWIRSRAYGVNPGLARFPTDERGTQWSDDERLLLELAVPALKACSAELHESSALLVLSSTSGRILYRDGNEWALEAADSINSVPGALSREDASGTNSLGTALHVGAAVAIHTWQHFCEPLWAWSDIGIPVSHPITGERIGAIDIGVYKRPLGTAFGLALTAMAGRVQMQILEWEMKLRQQLLTSWARRRSPDAQASLAVDRHGRIVSATPAAMRLLCLADVTPNGIPLAQLPALSGLETALDGDTPGDRQWTGPGGDKLVEIERVSHNGRWVGAFARIETRSGKPSRAHANWRPRYRFSGLVGRHPAFLAAKQSAERMADTDIPVLLFGETGTGKELFAHAMHAASARADGPFVSVNCGAIPNELIASELFGYEGGAFTGAEARGKRGKFEVADGGTLFLDEITETSAALQVSLLRVLEAAEISPIGSERKRNVDVRIISACNRDPLDALHKGLLRQDLYYRLRGVAIRLPALRERTPDIPDLVRHLSQGRAEFSAEALEMLVRHPWPGNVRELAAVVRSAVALAANGRVEPADLIGILDTSRPSSSAAFDIEAAEADTIERAMREARGNVKMAASLLGLARSTLYRKLVRLKMTRRSEWVSAPSRDDA